MHPASRLALSGCKGASQRPRVLFAEQGRFWRDWLTHTDSLTARIKSRCQHFEVRVLYEGRDSLSPPEKHLLRTRGPWRAREVVLLADGEPVVWARTVVAERAIRGPWFFLKGLGARPLGARLFSDPLIERSQFVYIQRYRLPQYASLEKRMTLPSGSHLARCARLKRYSAPALLTEVLLPSLRDICN